MSCLLCRRGYMCTCVYLSIIHARSAAGTLLEFLTVMCPPPTPTMLLVTPLEVIAVQWGSGPSIVPLPDIVPVKLRGTDEMSSRHLL